MGKGGMAIGVKGVCKQYTIAHEEKHSTLAETWLARMKNPMRRARRETFQALRDVSFEVKKGEVVGIIGRNGAGKSTLLKILSRITEPTSGEIDLYGRVGSLLEVGTGFHPELTGRENIYLNGAILGMRRREIEGQFDAIVDFSEVEKFLDTPVKRYSSGMYVRLAFAVAAHLNPEILIVDEVLAVGDAQFQKKCLGKMREISEGEGRTVIFVSHNMGAVASLCTKGILINKGEVLQAGRVEDVIATYVDPNNGIFPTVAFASMLKDDGTVRFVGIEARQEGKETSLVDCRQPIEIILEFEIGRVEPAMRLLLSFRNGTGEILFITGDLDARQGEYVRREPGRYKARVVIPGGLLRCGALLGTFFADVKGERILAIAENVLQLEVMDGVVDTESERHIRNGILAPVFEWEIRRT